MIETFNCPSCDASLDLPVDPAQITVKCPFCGTTVVVPEKLRPAKEPADTEIYQEILTLVQQGRKIEAIKLYRESFGVGLKEAKESVEALAEGLPAGSGPQPAKSSRCGCWLGLLALFILAGVGAALFFLPVQRNTSGPDAVMEQFTTVMSRENLNGPALLLPVGDGILADVVFTSRSVEREEMYANWLDGAAGARKWQSDPFADDTSHLSLYADDRYVYYLHGSEITALDKGTGTAVWHTILSDRLPTNCETCLHTFDDTLIVLSLDANLQALDTATGAHIWQTQLDMLRPNGFYVIEDQFGIILEEENTGMSLALFDPASGAVTRRIEPRCAHDFFDPQEPEHDDPVVVDEAEHSLYFIFGFFEPICVQRWDYQTNSLLWDIPLDVLSFYGENGAVQDAANLYFNGDNTQIYTANKADGAARLLIEDENYQLRPITAVNNILLVQATKTRGTRRDELWGVDVDSGDRRWQHIPQADTMLADNLVVVHDGDAGYWHINAANTGVQLLQARSDPPRLVLETLAWQNGASGGQTEISLDLDASSSYWFDMLGWDGDTVWLEIELDRLLAVEAGTAEVKARWP